MGAMDMVEDVCVPRPGLDALMTTRAGSFVCLGRVPFEKHRVDLFRQDVCRHRCRAGVLDRNLWVDLCTDVTSMCLFLYALRAVILYI